MNLTQLYLDTFIPEYPRIINGNFASVSRYVDVFYDGSLGILTKPLNTTGRVKGTRGEFVTVVVDNLIVKNQFTNLFDNNTTADYNFYKLYIDPAVVPRDPCTAIDFWPFENYPGAKVIDVNEPYYKITNKETLVLNNNNLSQVVGIFLDPSLSDPTAQFRILIDPCAGRYFTVNASEVGDPSSGTGVYIEFIAASYDASWGTVWAQYKQGLAGTAGSNDPSSAIQGSGTPNTIAMFDAAKSIADSPLTITGGTILNTSAINVDGIITLTNKKITGLATPTNPSDATTKVYVDTFFVTNVSIAGYDFTSFAYVDGSLAQRDTSIAWLQNNITPSSLTIGYVDGSLSVRDVSILWLQNNKANDASLVVYATNASIGLAAFAKNASFGLYATNASIGLAAYAKNASLGLYATNASVGLSLYPYATNASVGLSLYPYATNASVGLTIAPFATNASIGTAAFAKNASFNIYATNASINAAGFATNASIGTAAFAKNASFDDYATNASINAAGFTTNVSVNTALTLYILSSSTGFGLFWNGGILDVSIAGITDAATNASVGIALGAYTTNASANYAFLVFNTSVNNAFYNYYTSAQVDTLLLGYIDKAYVDASFYQQELQILSLDNRITVFEISTGFTSFSYVDPSLLTRDSSIILLFNKLFTTDNSLNILRLRYNISEVSLGLLEASIGDYATNASVNIAAFARNASFNFYCTNVSANLAFDINTGAHLIFSNDLLLSENRIDGTETSIAYLNIHKPNDTSFNANDFVWVNGYLEASIAGVTDPATKTYVDGSLAQRDVSILWLQDNKANLTDLYPYATNASIGTAAFAKNASFNAYATNASIGTAAFAKNASFNSYATNASIGTAAFAKNASFNIYATNASVGLSLYPYATNASIGIAAFLKVTDASATYGKRLTSFTNCITAYLANPSDNNNVIDASGTFTITFPNTLETGFSTTVFNMGTGAITLSASTFLSTDASVTLRDRYAAASVICRSAGIFISAGNLK